MLTKTKKIKLIENLTDNLKKQKIVLLVNFNKLSVKDLSRLKKELKKADAHLKIIKKSLLQRAFKNEDFNIDLSQFKVPCAIIMGQKDEVEPARIVNAFIKTNKVLEILGGFLNKKFLDANQIIALSKLASKNDQLALLVGSLNSSLVRFVRLPNSLIQKFVCLLNNIKNKNKGSPIS